MRVLRWTLAFFLCAAAAHAQGNFTVTTTTIADQKAVFATVEASNVVPARARIGGTLVSFSVQDGDLVKAGQEIAMVADPAMAQQLEALDADIAAAKAQQAQAEIDFIRAQKLIRSGAVSQSVFDQAQTGLAVAQNTLKAKIAAHAALAQQIGEGAVLAPVAGRVLTTPVTEGTVVLAGDSVATIAEQGYVLRLDIPEHHAAYLHVGDPVRLDEKGHAEFGKITLIYPQITNGRVQADATAPDVGSYFVGGRVQVWVYAGSRAGIVIPERFIETRFGMDYVRLQTKGGIIAIPVQRGMPQPIPAMPDGVEILSGLAAGDVLVPPGAAP